MKKSSGFTLIEVLVALGIMSIALVFLANGIYSIDSLSEENQRTLEMGKILQENIEKLLSEDNKITSQIYEYEEYKVEVIVEPYKTTDLLILQVIITDLFDNEVNAGVVYNQAEP